MSFVSQQLFSIVDDLFYDPFNLNIFMIKAELGAKISNKGSFWSLWCFRLEWSESEAKGNLNDFSVWVFLGGNQNQKQRHSLPVWIPVDTLIFI